MRRTACRVGSEAQHDNGARAVGMGLGAQECVDLDGRNGAPCRRVARLVCRARRLEPDTARSRYRRLGRSQPTADGAAAR